MPSSSRIANVLTERLRVFDFVGAWAASTERALGAEPFQRDLVFLGRMLRLMEIFARYFDGEVRGLEHVPADGPVLLVGNHSGGSLTPDTAIFFAAWYRARGLDAPLIGLAFDAAFGIPGFETLMRKIGEVPANGANAVRALDAGHAVLVYPGGDHEAFRPWTERNRIDFNRRKGFIKLALRKGVPVVPVVSHGGHHTTTILSRGEWLGRLLGTDRIRTPTFPIAWQIPWGVSPFAVPGIPLPAKITIQVLPPMAWSHLGPEAADDAATVAGCYREITTRMQATLDELVAEHPHPLLARARSLLPWSAAPRGS
jgi:1-acyl-sn-glycerol-3-phosphate acyltransferase